MYTHEVSNLHMRRTHTLSLTVSVSPSLSLTTLCSENGQNRSIMHKSFSEYFFMLDQFLLSSVLANAILPARAAVYF